jgi:para-aminobenzoate synthetase component 1
MDTSICIRTPDRRSRSAAAGRGRIIADSDPDAEYQETYDKVARILPLLDAL